QLLQPSVDGGVDRGVGLGEPVGLERGQRSLLGHLPLDRARADHDAPGGPGHPAGDGALPAAQLAADAEVAMKRALHGWSISRGRVVGGRSPTGRGTLAAVPRAYQTGTMVAVRQLNSRAGCA